MGSSFNSGLLQKYDIGLDILHIRESSWLDKVPGKRFLYALAADSYYLINEHAQIKLHRWIAS